MKYNSNIKFGITDTYFCFSFLSPSSWELERCVSNIVCEYHLRRVSQWQKRQLMQKNLNGTLPRLKDGLGCTDKILLWHLVATTSLINACQVTNAGSTETTRERNVRQYDSRYRWWAVWCQTANCRRGKAAAYEPPSCVSPGPTPLRYTGHKSLLQPLYWLYG